MKTSWVSLVYFSSFCFINTCVPRANFKTNNSVIRKQVQPMINLNSQGDDQVERKMLN